MKKTIITILLALVAVAGQAQKQVVWEKPSAFIRNTGTEFKITKVELKQTETVLHVSAKFYPGDWIRFDKKSFLQTPDGKKYTITGRVMAKGISSSGASMTARTSRKWCFLTNGRM